jgi:hypothetical protein
MPIGTFLDSMPTILFTSTHVVLFLIGLWAAKKAMDLKLPYAYAFWLYPIVHVGFLAYFGGFFTFKMAVFLEQLLMITMVVWIVSKAQRAS